jgi:CBS domain-containing protein
MSRMRFKQTPADFGSGKKDVVCVKEDDKVGEAFRLLREKDLNAVGVLDEEGEELLTYGFAYRFFLWI